MQSVHLRVKGKSSRERAQGKELKRELKRECLAGIYLDEEEPCPRGLFFFGFFQLQVLTG